jgi:hypothetical protein
LILGAVASDSTSVRSDCPVCRIFGCLTLDGSLGECCVFGRFAGPLVSARDGGERQAMELLAFFNRSNNFTKISNYSQIKSAQISLKKNLFTIDNNKSFSTFSSKIKLHNFLANFIVIYFSFLFSKFITQSSVFIFQKFSAKLFEFSK